MKYKVKMKKILVVLFVFIQCSVFAFAGKNGLQSNNSPFLQLDIPERANQSFYLLIKKGISTDTIVNDRFDSKGQYIFRSEKEKLSPGIMVLSMPPYTWFEFVWSGNESFTIRCPEEYPHMENVIFENSIENTTLDRWFREEFLREQKQQLTEEGVKVYKENEFLHFVYKTEKQRIQQENIRFADSLKNSPLYAASYLEIRHFLSKKAALLVVNPDSVLWSDTRAYLRDSLNMESLYSSNQWFEVINACLELYANGNRYHDYFGKDMIGLLQRIDSQEVFNALAGNLMTMCEQFNWQKAEEEIVDYLAVSGRVTHPAGKLKKLIQLSQVKPGHPAPLISASNEISFNRPSVIFFYESGCHNCEVQLEEMKKHYPELQKKDFRIVSVSADLDQHVFEYHSKNLPWQDKLCDYKGFEGENFKNYGVFGTPVIFLIDEKGIIKGRYARLEDMGILN